MTDSTPDGRTPDDEPADEHLADFDGCAGCVEVWEHLSERREREAGAEGRHGSSE